MKGVDCLITAIPHILSRNKSDNLIFIFAGPGNKYLYLGKTVQLGISRFCLFTGPLPKEQVVELMKVSDLVVVPSSLKTRLM